MGQPIAGIESLLAQRTDGQLIFHYEPYLLDELSKANRQQLLECGAFCDRATAVAIVDAVRTLILEWAIEVEKTGIKGTDVNFSDQEQKIAAGAPISIHIGSITGFTGTLGVGNVARDATSSALQIDHVQNLVNEIKSHVAALSSEGLDEQELMQRIEALEAELRKRTPDRGVIANLLTELRSIVAETARGIVSSGLVTLLNQILGTGVPG
jgi:hypothetical protein